VAVHFCEVEYTTAVVSMNKMCEKSPQIGDGHSAHAEPILFCSREIIRFIGMAKVDLSRLFAPPARTVAVP